MENIEKVDTQTTEKKEEVVDTQATEKNEEVEVKTFTQAELDEMIKERLDREKKKLPSKEELTQFSEWKESLKTEAERQAEVLKEIEQYKIEKENIAKENILLKKGINSEDLDYIVFKVSKMEGEFEENTELFLKENPRFIETKEELKTTGMKATGITNKDDGVVSILKARHPELYK